jgi:hypothetical protein
MKYSKPLFFGDTCTWYEVPAKLALAIRFKQYEPLTESDIQDLEQFLSEIPETTCIDIGEFNTLSDPTVVIFLTNQE